MTAAKRLAAIRDLLERGAGDEEDPIVSYTPNGTLVSRCPTPFELRELHHLATPAKTRRRNAAGRKR